MYLRLKETKKEKTNVKTRLRTVSHNRLKVASSRRNTSQLKVSSFSIKKSPSTMGFFMVAGAGLAYLCRARFHL